jgi:hypothetical protein
MSSILDDIKHMLGITPEETAFDVDIINYINGAFGTLTQLGVGPAVGFQITSKLNQWAEFYTDPRLNSVTTFVFLRTKLAFDPPPTGFATEAMERQIRELEFRLNVVADYG